MTIDRRAFAVRWKDSSRWDIKAAKATLFRLAHADFRALADFAEEATEMVRPMDAPDHEWPVYGVNNTEGVFRSHHQKGEKFNAPYKRIQKDWFFHNPTRANVGSLGRVPDVPDDAITSPEYQVWRLREGLLPEFVEILIKTRFFTDLIEYHRVGAVKERLFVRNLLEIPIPNVPERQQRAVVSMWDQAQAEIAGIRRRIAELEGQIEADFLADLALTKPKRATLPKVFASAWKDFERWSVLYNQVVKSQVDVAAGKYPASVLGDVLVFVQYGTSKKANTTGKGTPIIRMNNIVNGEFNLSDLKHVHLPERERKNLLVRDGDILINRTNSKELVGKCAVFHALGEYVFASYLIRLRTEPEDIDPNFLALALNSIIGRQQVDMLSRQIGGQANINTEELRSIQIPRPPYSVQKIIMAKVSVHRHRITALKAEANLKTQKAKADVKAMILGDKTVAA